LEPPSPLGKNDNTCMSVSEILRNIGERFESSATVKNVYGEPISTGNRTVIPVARVSYAFGGGGGVREGEPASQWGGGGGRLSAVPAGVIEITSEGTRFIAFLDWRKLASVVGVSFALGFLFSTWRQSS
jgi:uncharacterized spore protein YtfJ